MHVLVKILFSVLTPALMGEIWALGVLIQRWRGSDGWVEMMDALGVLVLFAIVMATLLTMILVGFSAYLPWSRNRQQRMTS